jgi:CheY-like chemotaxis protein
MDPGVIVLLVEDNPDDALLMQRAFQSHGVARPPHVCRSSDEAVAYLSGAGAHANRVMYPLPDLIITDLKMPGTNGFELLEWLRGRDELVSVPKLVWSSSAEARDVNRAYALGAHGYLCKPSDFQKFKEMVRDMLHFWRWCEKPFRHPRSLGGTQPGAPRPAIERNHDRISP